ncbi:hypothetical protein PM082_006738 [Marasmius tenuissimus]|nr:hypothetical protein PM082_006738 [Marasmius tenuissimus]
METPRLSRIVHPNIASLNIDLSHDHVQHYGPRWRVHHGDKTLYDFVDSLTSFLIASGCPQTLTHLTLKRELILKIPRFTPYLRSLMLKEREFLERRILMVKACFSILCLPIILASIHTDNILPNLKDIRIVAHEID